MPWLYSKPFDGFAYISDPIKGRSTIHIIPCPRCAFDVVCALQRNTFDPAGLVDAMEKHFAGSSIKIDWATRRENAVQSTPKKVVE